MSQGTVTVTPAGGVTSSGLAGAIFDARIAMLALLTPPGPVPAGPSGYALKYGLSLDANALASAIFSAGSQPTGSIVAFAAAAAPTGWLLCDGTAVSRTTYADLFAAIGIVYGAGNGTTTFNVPDGRGRTLIGSGTGDAADATAHALGSKTGTETHTLTTAQLAAHSHGITDAGHVHGPNVGTAFLTISGTGTLDSAAGSTVSESSAQTASATTGISVNNAGGGDDHPNMQPSLTVNWIIKT
jgi:microcystin-dependent protein